MHHERTYLNAAPCRRSFRTTCVTEHTSIIFRFEFLSRLRKSLPFDVILCLDHMAHPLTLLAYLRRHSNSTDHRNDKLYQALKHRGILLKRLNTFSDRPFVVTDTALGQFGSTLCPIVRGRCHLHICLLNLVLNVSIYRELEVPSQGNRFPELFLLGDIP